MKTLLLSILLLPLPLLAAESAAVSRAKAAELALHRAERLVTLAKIPDSYLWKLGRITALPPAEGAPEKTVHHIVLQQYPDVSGKTSSLRLFLDAAGKTLKSIPTLAGEPVQAPAWPDKDAVTLAENALHYVLDNVAAKPELGPYFDTFESLTLRGVAGTDGNLVARADIRAARVPKVLRVWIRADGNFASAELVSPEENR